MELVSTIIGVIIIAICFLPILIMNRNRKNKEKEKIQSLKMFAKQHNCNIMIHEVCGDFAIGIDPTNKFVFFLKQLESLPVKQVINLKNIQRCKERTSTRSIESKNGGYSIIEKIELCFIHIEKSKKEITFDFFNSENSSQLVGELQSVEKWSKIINDCLKGEKV